MKLKFEDNMRLHISQPEFKILASFVPFTFDRYKYRGRMIPKHNTNTNSEQLEYL
jgi:hypothetical protein